MITKSLLELLNELRAKIRDKASREHLDEIENLFRQQKNDFQKQKQLDEDEIAVLRNLAGTSEEGVKLRFAGQEKNISRTKRDLEDLQFKLKSVQQKNYDLIEENQRLQAQNESLQQVSARTKGEWEWSVLGLQEEKKILLQQVEELELKLNNLAGELRETTEFVQKKAQEDQESLKEKWLSQMAEQTVQQKWQMLNEERVLLQGLYTYIQNHIGGVTGSSQLLKERVSALRPQGQTGLTFLGKLFNLPMSIVRAPEIQRKIDLELGLLEQILQQNWESLEKLMKGFSDFSPFVKGQEPRPEKIFLTEILEEALKGTEDIMKTRKIQLQNNWRELLPAYADKGLVRSALREILDNAIDAQPHGGQIEISYVDDVELRVVGVSVKDKGPGVPPNLREKIFQPFFTTKTDHSGLGLTRVFRWMTLNNGFIECALEPPGAEMVVKLPKFKE